MIPVGIVFFFLEIVVEIVVEVVECRFLVHRRLGGQILLVPELVIGVLRIVSAREPSAP